MFPTTKRVTLIPLAVNFNRQIMDTENTNNDFLLPYKPTQKSNYDLQHFIWACLFSPGLKSKAMASGKKIRTDLILSKYLLQKCVQEHPNWQDKIIKN